MVSTANTPYASAASTSTGVNTGGSSFVYLGGKIPIDASTLPNADLPIDPNMPDLEDDSNVFPNDGIFSGAYDDEDVGAEADFNNMDNTIDVSPIPTLKVHKDHPKGQILGDPKSAVQTRGKIQKASSVQQALVSYISNQNRTNHKDYQNCLLACFLSQEEPKTISQALKDESWVEAMQEELLQIEAIKLFLAFASFMGFPVYRMDVKSAFLYGTIEDEVYVHQPPGFVDPAHPNKVYKVIKALYGLHQAPRAWYETLSSFLLKNGFRRGTSLRYALTHNPTIYDSLVKQFWQTAKVRTLSNGTPELVASIDNKEYTITEASVQLRIKGPTFTHIADEATTTGVRVGTEGATTITSGLDAGLDSGNIHESLLRITNLEKELHQTKTTYGKAVLTLVEKGRKIQDIDDDPLVCLVRESIKEKDTDFMTLIKISASGESTDKGRRYKKKTRSKSIEKDISTDLDADIEDNPSSDDFNTGK
ncbi:putative ribonuclease H-like domain-containing protein [Tanacetum coccineum]